MKLKTHKKELSQGNILNDMTDRSMKHQNACQETEFQDSFYVVILHCLLECLLHWC